MSIDLLVSKLQNSATLYFEIILCIVAASVLGWLIGMMMQRSRHKKLVEKTVGEWENRFYTLEDSTRNESRILEDQLSLANKELESQQSGNQELKDSLRKNEYSIQQARAETIALNRQHTETHERLQRIVQQKDIEIAELGARVNTLTQLNREANSRLSAGQTSDEHQLSEFSAKDLDGADTVALLPSDLPEEEPLDATIQISLAAHITAEKKGTEPPDTPDSESSLDNTSDSEGIEIEESTLLISEDLLDPEKLARKTKFSE